jgi:hypothetical protein
MLCTLSNLKGLVTAAKRDAANHNISEADLYARAGVTQAKADALYNALGAIDHDTLIRLMNVTRGAIGVVQFNGYSAGSDVAAPGNTSGNLAVTHNASICSVLGDLSA